MRRPGALADIADLGTRLKILNISADLADSADLGDLASDASETSGTSEAELIQLHTLLCEDLLKLISRCRPQSCCESPILGRGSDEGSDRDVSTSPQP